MCKSNEGKVLYQIFWHKSNKFSLAQAETQIIKFNNFFWMFMFCAILEFLKLKIEEQDDKVCKIRMKLSDARTYFSAEISC